jgi:hypothetical protein
MDISKKSFCIFIKNKLRTDKGWALGALQKIYDFQDEWEERGVIVYTTLEYMLQQQGVVTGEIFFETEEAIDIPDEYIFEIKYLKTRLNNGVGFNKIDSEILSSLHNFYKERGFLTEKQYALLFKKIPKYHKQIYNISDKEKLKKMYLKEVHCLAV